MHQFGCAGVEVACWRPADAPLCLDLRLTQPARPAKPTAAGAVAAWLDGEAASFFC
jgi:hypothetical protein